MEGQAVKVYTVGLVVLSCFPSSREFSSPAIFTRGLAWGSLNPLHDTHTHTHWEYIHALLSLSISLFLSVTWFSLCLSVSSSLSQLLSSPVQCSVSESLKSIPDHFLWHTQQKPVCQLLHWQDEAKLPQKVVWVYVSICKIEQCEYSTALHTFACMWCHTCLFAVRSFLHVFIWGKSLRHAVVEMCIVK